MEGFFANSKVACWALKKILLTIYQNYPLEVRGYETGDDDGDTWGKFFSDDGNEKNLDLVLLS